MSCHNKKHSPMSHVVRFTSRLAALLLLACASLFCAPAAFAVDSGDIVVVSTKGEVHITMNGAERSVRAGGVLELPAAVRTGRDGNIELRQGATTVSVGPETLLEFPALEKRGAPIDRILQPRGNAFYNIGKRDGRKLRVETPYLVGVIKGTQFNVASQEESTTISLFEGLLEVRATDDSDVIDLKAGEIASRRRGDKSISVLRMDAGKAPPTSSRPSPVGGSDDAAPNPTAPRSAPTREGGDSLLADRELTNTPAIVPANLPASVDFDTDVRTGESAIEVGAAPTVNPGQDVDVSTSVAMNAAAAGIDVGVDTAVNVGDTVDATANVAVGLGPTGVDAVTSVAVDLGPAAVDVGVTAAVDLAAGTVDVNTGATVDAGPVTVDLGTSTNVDLGAGAIDTSTTTGVNAGPLTTDVATNVAVDLTSGAVDTAVDVGVGTPMANVDLGVGAAVDVGAGTIDLGVAAGGADIDLGVNVADTVDTVETVTGTVTDTVTNTVVDVGGLLDGLIRRPGRR
jgi:hypothetical protein